MAKRISDKILAIVMALSIVLTMFSVVATKPVIAQAKEVTCTHCGGRGVQTCTICGGLGYEYMMTISGYEWKTCVRCHGRGEYNCNYCNGFGWVYVSDSTDSSSSSSSSSKKPSKTSITKLTAKKKGFKVTWKKRTKKTSGYQVQYSTSSKFKKSSRKTKTVKGKSKTFLTVNGLKGNKKYYVRIRAYRKLNGKRYYSKWSKGKSVVTEPIIKPDKVSIKKLTSLKGGFIIGWKKHTKNTSGFQIQYATNSKFTKNKKTKTVKGNKKTNIKINSLQGKKKYYVRVRAYRIANGKKYYSAWTKTKKVVAKKSDYDASTKPLPTSFRINTTRLSGWSRIYFKHVKNCTGYQLQMADYSSYYFETGDDYYVCTYTCPYNNGDLSGNKSTYTVKGWEWNLKKDEYDEYYIERWFDTGVSHTCYLRMRTYSKINGKKYYSKWTEIQSVLIN
ncbi:MAG: fibronectin type III domain-containing protein [Eubacterium sp.]|nr:fibronectin type III domain-containing protein [Eubacterium sp.]